MANPSGKRGRIDPKDCAQARVDILCQCFFALGAGAGLEGGDGVEISRGAAHALRESLVIGPVGSENWLAFEARWKQDKAKVLKLLAEVGADAVTTGGAKVKHGPLKGAFEKKQTLKCPNMVGNPRRSRGKYCKGFEDAPHE